jgi:PAS domain S-box-containing protein
VPERSDTDLLVALAALRESEARYRTALAAGRMGSWETDFVAATRTWSPEAMALFGITLAGGRGQVGGAGDEYAAALHPEDRHLVQRFHALADQQDSFLAEYRIVRPDGAVLHLSGRGLVVARRPDGRAHRLVSIMADVSEHRHAESILRLERERLGLALEAGQMGVYDLDLVAGALWWSPQTYAVFGVDPERFVPTPESVADLIHPDDRPGFMQRRAAAIANHLPLAHEIRIVRGDGAVRWIAHRGKTEYDHAGKAVRTFGVAMDITDRRNAEDALRDADRKKDDFIATLAHELRNPLAPIRNAAHVLRRKELAPAKIAWCGDVIERQAAQMSRLLEDLLDVARMARGQVQLRRERVLLKAVLEQAIETAQPLIDGAGHTLEARQSTEPIEIDGDPMRLAQVFSNLLINAAKYTPRGGRIAVAVERDGSDVVVRVSDTGIGIAPAQMPHIFAMFGQVQSALDRSRGGLGIGLSLSKKLVEMHGGRISAHSEGTGRGSELIVRLPVAAPALHLAAASRPAGDRPASGARRVLVADDLHDSADSLAALLASLGHVVDVAYDGEQALRLAEALRPDVVVLDLGMPALNGFDVCRRIRAEPWGRAMRVIAQTGWGQEDDRQRTRAAGFDHHVVKPIDVAALDALVRAPGANASTAAERLGAPR